MDVPFHLHLLKTTIGTRKWKCASWLWRDIRKVMHSPDGNNSSRCFLCVSEKPNHREESKGETK